MEAILDSINEEHPQFRDSWISTFNSSIFDVDVLALKANNIFFILWNETRNLTGSQHTVNGFKEGLSFNFRISQNESNTVSFWTSFSVKVLNIILQVVVVIGLCQRNLEEDLLANE